LIIQIFGVKNSPATRAAERFFKERRVAFQFIDLNKKPMAPGEIRRFVERFGLNQLLDSESVAYVDAGLKYLKTSEAELLARIEQEPKLLKLPLVRSAKRLSVGDNEAAWKAMADDPG
jgi:arsenate reductase-like glutaredoxin family protein